MPSKTVRAAPSALMLMLLLLITHTAVGFSELLLPDRVFTERDLHATLFTDFNESSDKVGSSVNARFSHFDVILNALPPVNDSIEGTRWYDEQIMLCLLANRTELRGNASELVLRIPASTVPAPGHYSLTTILYNVHEYNVVPDMSTVSFELLSRGEGSNGEGEWAEFEKDPRINFGIGYPYKIPCHAYNCARNCQQDSYPDIMDHLDEPAAFQPMLKCMAACPGVDAPLLPWDNVELFIRMREYLRNNEPWQLS